MGSPEKSFPAAFCRKKQGETFLLSFSTMRKKVSKACPEHFTSFSTGSVEGKESPTPLYRPIITPQHLWLDCYFFFVSSNKEKVTKKACPEQGRGKPIVTFLLSGQKKGNRKKTRPPTLRKVCNATAQARER